MELKEKVVGAEDYGIDLFAVYEEAKVAGDELLVAAFDEMWKEVEEGKTNWYTSVCNRIAFLVSQTGMKMSDIAPEEIYSAKVTDVDGVNTDETVGGQE